MLAFLSTYWIWILIIGGMAFMHLGHRGHGGHGGGHGGCGGGHAEHTATEHPATSDHTGRDAAPADPVKVSAGAHDHHTP